MGTVPVTGNERIDPFVAGAQFIFTGRVVKPVGSTVSALAGRADVGVVKIEAVFRGPATLGPLKGKLLTVRFAEGKPSKVGTRALFYAGSWIYAEGVAVVERSRSAPPKDDKEMLARVAAAELRLHDDKLLSRLRLATIVLSGLVEETEVYERTEGGRRSEHDPVWWRAWVVVEHADKGRLREPRLAIYFPSSLDEYWIDVPKLHPGQRGTFILHRTATGKSARFAPPGLAILDALDYQPQVQTERVRSLLKLGSVQE